MTKRRGLNRQKEFLETVQEEMTRRLKARIEQDPTLIANLDRIANKESEPYSAALEFLENTGFNAE